MRRAPRLLLPATLTLLLLCGAGGLWWWTAPPPASSEEEPELPVPPFPPRITDDSRYEACLAALETDPPSALSIAEAWAADGGGDGAWHCRGLALVATGKPAAGASMLEQLAQQSTAPAPARALVLGQAVQARLMVGEADHAAADATLALSLSPADPDLLIMRASAHSAMDRFQDADDDLTTALQLDPTRPDALVARATMRRKLDRLPAAEADITQALTIDPDSADALLERGILRQLMGDSAGARTDWERARGLDPNSTTADLAEQNLSLLDAGPLRQ